ncbi:endonuclease/exonuclease/phosphatase family protein [Actinoplanes sp. NPDC049596]|uniref:endonuclease/exonuclease/phosphatase family protein n=1 Tax=unclassified Actinoplanes TaxID=2626549 RepID=UPI00341EC4C6
MAIAVRPLLSTLLILVTVVAATGVPARAATSAMEELAGPPAATDLHVMTFNLRFADTASPNSWRDRRPVMRTLLTVEQPDLIGTQEGLAAQLRDIKHDLGGDYDYIGTPRQAGPGGESMAIFYRLDRLTPQTYGHFWLSDTPEIPGSETWGGFAVRMVTWARFLDRATGKRFYAVNTHLDNLSEHARRRAATLIRARLAALDPPLPIILTGDFNTPAQPAGPVHDLLVTQAGYRDTWITASVHSAPYGTFHAYRPLVPNGPRIDWILTTPGVTVSAALINLYRTGPQYPSDHLPVQVRLRLP